MQTNRGHQEQLRRIAARARAAMSTMADARVPMTPENYAVFFAYAENRLPQLTAFIDRLFADGRPFTPALCTAVHRRFLDTASGLDAVREANERLSRTLNAVQHDVGAARQLTADFGGVLKEHRDPDPARRCTGRDALSVEVDRVIGQLGAIRTRLQRFEREVAELNARLAEAERDALIDPLTSLGNRRYFDQQLAAMATACREAGRDLSVLMADIDFFKTFNDRHGHGVGDQVLRLVGNVILDNVRPGDLAARYGGEEFAVLLPGAAAAEALEVARRINRALGSRPFVTRHSRRRLGYVTVSIGVAQLRPDESAAAALRRADRTLYLAKRNGRNQVHSAEPAALPPADPDDAPNADPLPA